MKFFNNFFSKEKKETLDKGLDRTKQGLFSKITRAVAGKSKVDDDVLDNLEEVFVTSDVGVDTTLKIIERIEQRVARDKYVGSAELNRLLREEICELLAENNNESADADFTVPEGHHPHVIMVVGVNGVGKTTTIGKLSARMKGEGRRVLMAAADTFRAAAADQLEIWSERSGVELVRQYEGADPAAVVFDALSAAKARSADVVLIDTAGRLHNKQNLMNELNKISRVVDRELPGCDRETLLVLDATTGQNGLIQAKQFKEAAGITGIVLTKLDGSAKGGIVIAIAQELQVPVKFIGVGEGIDDLMPFEAEKFVEALV